MPSDTFVRDILRLTLAPGLGPILTRRALDAFGTPDAVLRASAATLKLKVKGIGDVLASQIAAALPTTDALAEEELALAAKLGVHLVAIGTPEYPPLLAQTPDPPPILYIRGRLSTELDRYPVAIVGSRTCTHCGREQSDRFAFHLAGSGLSIVSGGARGIDTAAHKAALRARGRTIAVLGCGLANCYPPDNQELFDQIAANDGACGAVVSELPLRTPPNAENFPARNRIISGLSLGVLVVEAGLRSGALITSRVAAEDHGREVFALPARVDSASAEGSLDLIKKGGAQLVTHPDDIIQALESPARHLHSGTHAARYSPPALFDQPSETEAVSNGTPPKPPAASPIRDAALTESQQQILVALDKPLTLDELSIQLNLDVIKLRSDITMLEIRRRVARAGSRFERVK
jgi:DNA processing protein